MTTFIKAACASGSGPSLFLPLITAAFACSGFIQRGERNLENCESDLKPDQRAPVRRAPPTPSHCSRVHRGRRISRPRAPPFCNTLLYTLSLSHCGSLSATHRPPLWDGQVEKTTQSPCVYRKTAWRQPTTLIRIKTRSTCSFMSVATFHQTLNHFSKDLLDTHEPPVGGSFVGIWLLYRCNPSQQPPNRLE